MVIHAKPDPDTRPYKVKIYVGGKLADTVKVRSDAELREQLPEIVVKCTRKGQGKIATHTIKDGKIEEVFLENVKQRKPYTRRPIGFLPPAIHEPRCPVSAPY